MDQSVHKAILAEITPEIAELEQKLAELKATANYHAAKLTPPPATHANNNGALHLREPEEHRVTGRFLRSTQVEAASTILREADKPLRAAEIAQTMLQHGFPTKDATKLRNGVFTTMTRRKDLFHKLEAGLWAIRR